jgi:fructosamine-3-kinase
MQSVRVFAAIAAALEGPLGIGVAAQPGARVHGGCINECYRWPSGRGDLFVKVTAVGALPALEAEAAGLEELAGAQAARIPGRLACGIAAQKAYLALEWIDLRRPAPSAAHARLGAQLARQHRVSAPAFGWQRDNTIGSTPQQNAWTADWADFFRDRRLRPQLDLARRNGHTGRLLQRGSELLERAGALLDHRPVPSLLHGDLWGGNWGVDDAGMPVLFDPAVYWGDREADLAMTRLFGGFSADFYATYESVWPLQPGASVRQTLYNLYHVLNHLNLFGGGYLAQAESMVDELLAQLGH